VSRKITRPQYEALRTAALFGEDLLSPVDALRGRLVVDARPNTAAVLIRLGVAEEVQGQTVLTNAGELLAATMVYGGDLPTLDTVAYYVANAAHRPAAVADGTYRPSVAGARTLREAGELWLDGKHVTAGVEGNGTRLYIFLGTEMIYSGDMPSGITATHDVNPWVRQYATGYVWAAEYRTLWSYRDHNGHVWGPYSDAEFAHTDGNAERYCRGIVDLNGAGEVIRIDRTPTDYATTGRNWTDTHTVVYVAGTPAAQEAQEGAQEAASAPVTVWATTETGTRLNYAHIPDGDPSRVALFLDAARAVPHFRDVSTTR
jgi:hypothetical protein